MESVAPLGQEYPFLDAGEQAALITQAWAALPVATALAVRIEGADEPDLVHGNLAFERLTGRYLSDAPCRLADLTESCRTPPHERRLHEHFQAGQAVSETLLIRDGEGAVQEMCCCWTPLGSDAGNGCAWSVTLTVSDAGARRATERALLRSEREAAHFRAMFNEAIECMTDGFVWFDCNGRLVLCNQKYRDLYPKLADALKAGAAYPDLMKLAFDRDQFTVLAVDARAIRDGLTSDLFPDHCTFRTKTSEGRWIEAHNNPLESGGFIGIRFDVTEAVAAEQALRESEQRFRDFAQSGPGGFWEMDESLRFSSFHDVQQASRCARPTAAEATGRTIWELFADDSRLQRHGPDLRRALDARRPIEDLRLAYVTPEGERFYWRINGKPYYDRGGCFRGYRGVAEDETAEVKARRRAEAAEARLIDAIESISGGFALFDAKDRLLLCNQTYRARAADHGAHIKPGISFADLVRVIAFSGCIAGLDSAEACEAWVRRRVASHQRADGSFEIAWRDGRIFLLTDRRTSDGGIASITTDITELKQARETAERANRAKTRFLAAASHDLRQPLHAIELLVAALEATAEGEEVRAIAADLRDASNAAGRLLNALLDVSELESGKLEGRFMDFPVQQLLERMARVYGPQARQRGLALRIVPSSQVVHSDEHLLERILGNLLSNAVRYTATGRVLVGCRRRGDRLRIEIWDTGPGIPEAERLRIFEEFHQLDNAARQRSRGTGLGLAIVRRLANILGHEIFLHSVRGKGSMFAVEIDLTGKSIVRPVRRAVGSSGATARRATVLVIDDDDQIRNGMARALESWGCSVETASDYEAAAAVATASPDSIDLIVTDYRLPSACNGVRAAGQLRALCRRMVPVLVVTADQGQEELREIAEQGLPALQKPVDPAALHAAIANLLEGFAVPGADAAQI